MAPLIDSGWLFAMVPAAMLAHGRLSARRRRRNLNRSLHELRRPLQAMALGGLNRNLPGGHGFLDLAMSALTDLDHLVNGAAVSPAAGPRELVSCREVVVAAVGRWRANTADEEIELFWDAGDAMLSADTAQLARALDNLFANAVQHGGPRMALTATVVCGKIRITLADSGRRLAGTARTPANGNSASSRDGAPDPRCGHGLAIVGDIARAHGGRFALSHSPQGTVAALELPLARTSRAG